MKPPSYQPSAQEQAAQRAAENDKIENIQDKLRGDTERMFRLFGASNALTGGGDGNGGGRFGGRMTPLGILPGATPLSLRDFISGKAFRV